MCCISILPPNRKSVGEVFLYTHKYLSMKPRRSAMHFWSGAHSNLYRDGYLKIMFFSGKSLTTTFLFFVRVPEWLCMCRKCKSLVKWFSLSLVKFFSLSLIFYFSLSSLSLAPVLFTRMGCHGY